MRTAAFFSGGKDSVYALMKAGEEGLHADILIFGIYDFPRLSPHFVNYGVVESIAKEAGIPLLACRMEKGKEAETTGLLLKKLGVDTIITGDISDAHLKWFTDICAPLHISYRTPLLLSGGRVSRDVVLEELDSGIRAVIVHVDGKRLQKECLGRVIDRDLVESIGKSCDPSGENGEYHTVVIGSPMMKRGINIIASEKFSIEDHHYLRITQHSPVEG